MNAEQRYKAVQAIEPLRWRIEQETPWIEVLGVVGEDHLKLAVKDSRLGNLCTAFSTEADYDAYCAVLGKLTMPQTASGTARETKGTTDDMSNRQPERKNQ